MSRNNLPVPSPELFHSFKLRLAIFAVVIIGLVALVCYTSCASELNHFVHSKENIYAR